MAAISDQVVVEVLAKTDQARRDIIRYAKTFDDADVSVRRSTDAMGKSVINFANTARAVLAGALVAQIIRTNKEFASLKTSLETATGSAEKAGVAFDALKQFAATTPYQLQEVISGFIKLKNYGLDPSIEALTSYGNTAGALGKTLDQMIEAVADAATGEFERLKEFGIRASKQGDQVRFTFQGVTTTVKFNAAEIERYLKRIGEVQFAGGMDKQAKTLGGALSNLQDSVDALTAKFGQGGFNDAVVDAAKALSDGSKGAESFAAQLGAVAGAAVTAATKLAGMIGTAGSWVNNFADRRAVAMNILPAEDVQAARNRLARTDPDYLEERIRATQRRLAVARAAANARGNLVERRPGGLLSRPANLVAQRGAAATAAIRRDEETLAKLLAEKARQSGAPAAAKAAADALAQFQTPGGGAPPASTTKKAKTKKPEESDISKRLGGYDNEGAAAIIVPEVVPPSDAEVQAAVDKVSAILGAVPPIEPVDIASFERAIDLAQDFTRDLSRGLADALVYGDDLGDVLRASFKRAAAALIESKILQLLDPQGTGAGAGSGKGFFGAAFNVAASVLQRSPGRASGGDVTAGRLYRVNEGGRGAEGFVPAGSGKIIPLGRMAAAQRGGGSTTIALTIPVDARGANDPQMVARVARAAVQEAAPQIIETTLRAVPGRLSRSQEYEG